VLIRVIRYIEMQMLFTLF